MILHRYFARRFGLWLLIVTFALGVVAAMSQVSELIADHPQIPAGRLAYLGLLRTPEAVYSISPLIVIFAGAITFLSLSRSSELTAARSAAQPVWRLVQGPAVATLIFGMLAVTLFNPLVAGSLRAYDSAASALPGSSVGFLGRDGLWLRQGDTDGQSVIYARDASVDGTILRQVEIYIYDAQAQMTRRLSAAQAQLDTAGWTLSDGKSWPIPAQNPEIEAERFAQMALPSTLTPESIRDSFGEPAAVPIWQLPAFITQLNEAGFPARRHLVWFHSEIAKPFFWLSMLLVAGSFTIRHHRAGGTEFMVMSAVLAGFALYFLRRFALILGNAGQLPAPVAAWIPVLACVLLALAMLLHLEDR